MDVTPKYYGWNHVAKEEAKVQFSAITGSNGRLWPLPYETLTESLQAGLAKPSELFISGYRGPVLVNDMGKEIALIGEIVTTTDNIRVHEGGKAYGHIVAINHDGEIWTKGPFKVRDGHYYNKDEGVDVDKLFGWIDLNDLSKKMIEPGSSKIKFLDYPFEGDKVAENVVKFMTKEELAEYLGKNQQPEQ